MHYRIILQQRQPGSKHRAELRQNWRLLWISARLQFYRSNMQPKLHTRRIVVHKKIICRGQS